MKVCKFGGSSLASSQSINTAKNIVLADPARTFVVVSAPGKCKEFPRKITDLLIDSHAELNFQDFSKSLEKVLNRFQILAGELEIDLASEIERAREEVMINKKNYDFVISRGEYLMALLFAKLLGFRFIDAANFIVIKPNGKFHEHATRAKFMRCIGKNEKVVMGGFYGSSINGGVKTFTRGGSDYSGAIASVCLSASLYENFTDTYGVQSANPALVKNTKNIAELDYLTMHRLSVAGASVIYPDCLPLLKRHATPLKVDNTFDSGVNFTRVTCENMNSKYFCITYKYEQNINKNMVEILCMYNKINLDLTDFREILKDIEVYLVRFDKHSFKLIAPATNLNSLVEVLHDYLIGL